MFKAFVCYWGIDKFYCMIENVDIYITFEAFGMFSMGKLKDYTLMYVWEHDGKVL